MTLSPEPEAPPRRVSLAGALRFAFGAYLDSIVVLFPVNVVWAVVVAAFALLRVGLPVAIVLAPLLAVPTSALMRLAVAAARDGVPSWSMARDELGRLVGRKVGLAAVQLLVTVIALVNVLVGSGVGGLPGILSAIVAGYALVVVTVYAHALWPIVCDPQREAPLGQQLRLAVAVVMLRPLTLGVLSLITVLAVLVSLQLLVPAIFLPSLVLLATAAYVVPFVDGLRPAPE